jgi:bisphosphoglycerate-independent phosphoglycerate mutase (AlkP superfamily)
MGDAISTDFTAQGWHDHLGIKDTPLLNPHQAGERLHLLTKTCELAFFEYWLTDIVGHHQDMEAAIDLLELFDTVLGSLADFWDDENGLIIVTSDHGNLEDLSTRRHTRNDVPLLLIGSPANREGFIDNLNQASGIKGKIDLTDITPAILSLYK